MTVRLLRVIHLAHRWLGMGAGVLILGWFVSGMVMLYVPFPKLDNEVRSAHQAPLDGAAVRVTPATAAQGCGAPPTGVRLAMWGGRPVYHFSGGREACSVGADDGQRWVVTAPLARAAASAFLPGVPVAAEDTVTRDQWTIYASFKPHRPLYRLTMADAAVTQLYVSSKSGEVVLATTRFERGWNWIGTVFHWFYFTPLRGDDTGTWRLLVTWLPGVAMATVLAGLVLGIQRLRLRRRYPQGRVTPYRGVKRWHHGLGLVFGGLALSWLTSGWLSNHPFGLLPFSGMPKSTAMTLAGGPFRPSADLSGLQRALAQVADVREVEWYRFGGADFMLLRSGDGRERRFDASGAPAQPIAPATLAAAVQTIEGVPVANVALIHAADVYYYGRRRTLVLPAVRVQLADVEDTTWYLDPASGRALARIDNANRWHRWVFNGVHRLDFPPLGSQAAWREAIVTTLCAAGALLAASGCLLAARRLGRSRARV